MLGAERPRDKPNLRFAGLRDAEDESDDDRVGIADSVNSGQLVDIHVESFCNCREGITLSYGICVWSRWSLRSAAGVRYLKHLTDLDLVRISYSI